MLFKENHNYPRFNHEPDGHRGHERTQAYQSLGATQELRAKVVLTGLVADPKFSAEKLPVIRADLHADVAATGVATVSVPLLVEREEFEGSMVSKLRLLRTEVQGVRSSAASSMTRAFFMRPALM